MTVLVEIRVGSDSDLPRIERAFAALEALQIPVEARVLSAHRTPQRTSARTRELERAGFRVVIAAAGGAAHLAGVTASETLLPVIGIPIETTQLKGLDSLLSTLQMPEGIRSGASGSRRRNPRRSSRRRSRAATIRRYGRGSARVADSARRRRRRGSSSRSRVQRRRRRAAKRWISSRGSA